MGRKWKVTYSLEKNVLRTEFASREFDTKKDANQYMEDLFNHVVDPDVDDIYGETYSEDLSNPEILDVMMEREENDS